MPVGPVLPESISVDTQVSTESAVAYWSDVPATIDGMLGGYPQVSPVDLRVSQIFISKLRLSASPPGTVTRGSRSRGSASSSGAAPLFARGADCGAGIGRITAGLLTRVCSVVDIVEPVQKFAEKARNLPIEELGEGRVGNVFVCGLEAWTPDPNTPYDLIWNQWCLGQLNNSDLRDYLRRCEAALRPGGWIVAKENISASKDLYDDLDNTITRTDESFRAVFESAGLKVVRSELQRGFPPALGLYRVRLYALQPSS